MTTKARVAQLTRALTSVLVMCEYLRRQGALREPKYDEACPYEPTTEGAILMRARAELAKGPERLPLEPPDGQEIRVRSTNSYDAGYCNACTDSCGDVPRKEQEITEVSLRSMTFRLCGRCKQELGRQLFYR